MLVTESDPAAFAAEVRDLAFQAHRVLTSVTVAPADLTQLSSRIARLRSPMNLMISEELSDWLDTLSQRLQSRYVVTGRDAMQSAVEQHVPMYT